MSLFDHEHFGEENWVSVLLGQGVIPQAYDPLAEIVDIEEVRSVFSRMRTMIHAAVETVPTHRQFIQRHRSAERGRHD